jgi:FkbM family methyltransferase
MSKTSYQLPNGHWVQQLNRYETDFLFQEIFVDQCYLKHGITLTPNASVFDIGANIGLFSLYIKQKFPSSNIYAFEPIPAIYQLLCLNLADFSTGVQTYNYGLAEQVKTAFFDYYPGYSVVSGLQVARQRAAEILSSGMPDPKEQDLLNRRLEPYTQLQCQFTTLSSMLSQANISQLDLLKIDVEGAELAVLQGIDDGDWSKIRQMVVEVHNADDLSAIMALLADKPFKLHLEADARLKGAGIYNLFAIGVASDSTA